MIDHMRRDTNPMATKRALEIMLSGRISTLIGFGRPDPGESTTQRRWQ